MSEGVTIWMTGLSGSGKSTIAGDLIKILKEKHKNVEWLDGDEVRRHLTADLGFSREDRRQNTRRVAYIAELLNKHGIHVIVSLISPYQSDRDDCRQHLSNYIEVYVKCRLDVCIKRDVKGLYRKALRGEIEKFTGVSDPYEEPVNPDIIVNTEKETVNESIEKILGYLNKEGYL